MTGGRGLGQQACLVVVVTVGFRVDIVTSTVGVVGMGSGIRGGGTAGLASPLEIGLAIRSHSAQAAIEVAVHHALSTGRMGDVGGVSSTSIQFLDERHVLGAHGQTLTHGHSLSLTGLGGDGGVGLVFGESIGAIVHDGTKIVVSAKHVHAAGSVLGEIVQILGVDVIRVDSDVGITIVTALLVPEAQRVVQLVHDGALALTPRADGQFLGTAVTPDRAVTACVFLDVDIITLSRPLHVTHTVGGAVLGVRLDLSHRLYDGGAGTRGESRADPVVDNAVRPTTIQVTDGIAKLGKFDVSLKVTFCNFRVFDSFKLFNFDLRFGFRPASHQPEEGEQKAKLHDC
eukprot:GHVL01018349.1.p2 GENE.GHVL01018349.1~~GHVL01018349.1.p2  ORF type:complete len:343 (-),score=20.23 GHVL01018349.1:90-1118(-)